MYGVIDIYGLSIPRGISLIQNNAMILKPYLNPTKIWTTKLRPTSFGSALRALFVKCNSLTLQPVAWCYLQLTLATNILVTWMWIIHLSSQTKSRAWHILWQSSMIQRVETHWQTESALHWLLLGVLWCSTGATWYHPSIMCTTRVCARFININHTLSSICFCQPLIMLNQTSKVSCFWNFHKFQINECTIDFPNNQHEFINKWTCSCAESGDLTPATYPWTCLCAKPALCRKLRAWAQWECVNSTTDLETPSTQKPCQDR